MAIYNLGWTGAQKSSTPSKPASSIKGKSSSTGQNVFFGVVDEVLINSSKPQGTIRYSSTLNKIPGEAIPLLSNITNYPIAGEMVLLFSFADTEYNKAGELSPFNERNRTFYISGINVWDNPSFNGVVETNQITNPLNPNYFNPNNGARSLQSYVGDIIIEGRLGNSIRLGSSYNTPWKSSNPNDPITIISNGAFNVNSQYVIENPNNDPSSIYLTSNQQLPFNLVKEEFISYNTKPELPSQFKTPQIILNSDRVILNAKTDSVLISGQKSVGLFSNESVNIESKQIYIDGNDIRLGSKDAKESVLLGDKTTQLLEILIKEVINLSTALQSPALFKVSPTLPSTAAIASNNLNKILVQLDNIKSNFVKTT